MRLLITGALGFVGSRLLAAAVGRGLDAVGVDSSFFNGLALGDEAKAIVDERRRLVGGALVELDVASAGFAALVRSRRPTHVVHLAGLSRADLAERAVAANVVPTQALLDALPPGEMLERLIFVSSSMVYGDFEEEPCSELHPCRPREAYGASKLACEALVLAHGRRGGHDAWVVRPSAVYGPGDFNQRVIERFARAALAGAPMTLFDEGREALDFTFVDDLVEGLLRAVTAGRAGEQVLNMTAGDARTLLDLSQIIRAYVPSARVQLSAERSGRPRRGTLDIGRARELVGYEPRVPLEAGVQRVLGALGLPASGPPIGRVSAPPRVALARPSIGEAEQAAVARVLRRGWLSHGPETRAFEDEFAAYLGGGEAVSANSGASALYLALRARGIRGEVIVPAFTFVATANAAALAGAQPVFADIEPGRLGLDPAAVEAALSPRTEAIVAVHIAGVPCRIDELRSLADRRGLFLLEDCAQAAGARLAGQPVGTFGGAGAFSFFPTKNMTTAEGGMLVTRDAALARKARALSAHGIEGSAHDRAASQRPWRRPVSMVGANLRMSAVHAALGRAQLARLDAMNARRGALAARLTERLAALPLRTLQAPPGASVVHQMFLARLDEPALRDELVMALRRRGVEASVHYDTALVDEAPFRCEGPFAVARAVAADVLSLPMHPQLSFAEVDRVASELALALAEVAAGGARRGAL